MELISARLKLAGLVILTAISAACTEKLDNSAGSFATLSGNVVRATRRFEPRSTSK